MGQETEGGQGPNWPVVPLEEEELLVGTFLGENEPASCRGLLVWELFGLPASVFLSPWRVLFCPESGRK